MPRNSKAKPAGQSRPRRASDDAYNARRRLMREVNRINKRATTPAERRYVGSLTKIAGETYKKPTESNAEYVQRVQRPIAAAQAQTAYDKKNAQARANAVFQNEMRLAGRGYTNTELGTSGAFKVKAFYAATRNIWQGLPPSMRNRAITAHFGVGSLQDAYNAVMGTPQAQQAVSVYQGASGGDVWTDEQEEFYGDSGDSEAAYENAMAYVSGLF